MSELIKELLQVEKKAEQTIREAEQHKTMAVAKALEHALTTSAEKKKEIEKAVDKEIRQKIEEIEKKKAAIEQQYAQEARQLEQKAQKNIPKGVSFLLKKIGEMQ